MIKPVIGIMGSAGCGKSTAARHLAMARKVALFEGFAWHLKDLCTEEFGWDLARLDDLDYKEASSGIPKPDGTGDWTRREILQKVGTDCFRAIDPDHWVKRALPDIQALLAQPCYAGVVVADVRFPNEAAAIRSLGGIIVLAERIGGPQATTTSSHASETAQAAIRPDFVIRASHGDLEKLRAMAEGAWEFAQLEIP